jgi:membrane protein implicated in regulation of membrane protease activity
MADSTLWWLLAGVCVAVELATGTFYLLMLAIGFVAAAITAYFGASLTTEVVVAAAVGGGAVAAWHVVRSRRPPGLAANANPDMNMDIGETLSVDHWNPDGTASVSYRGARWTVMQRDNAPPSTGLHKVVAVVGNRLMVDKA